MSLSISTLLFSKLFNLKLHICCGFLLIIYKKILFTHSNTIFLLQPKSAATLCRLSPGECDLPEFCDGETEYCPSDVHIMNGMPCSGGQVN